MSHTASVLVDVSEVESQTNKLFDIVDKDKNGYLEFTEVAALFKQLSPEQSTQSACNAAMEALMMSDENADKKLSREEFQQLLVKVSNLSGVPLLEAINKLLAVEAAAPSSIPSSMEAEAAAAEAAATAAAADAAATAAAAADPEAAAAGAAEQQHKKLLALFGLWDTAGDGRVNFGELCQGLAKFKPVTGKKDMASLLREAASVLAVHDSDGDRQLSFDEFVGFMSRFMAAAGYQLHDVLDELLTLAASKPDSKKLQQVLDSAQPQIQQLLSAGQQNQQQ